MKTRFPGGILSCLFYPRPPAPLPSSFTSHPLRGRGTLSIWLWLASSGSLRPRPGQSSEPSASARPRQRKAFPCLLREPVRRKISGAAYVRMPSCQ